MLPLNNIRVLDLSQLLPGPFCTWVLAAFGADVLRIEPPTTDGAHRLPPFAHGMSLFYLGLNRGKRNMILDLKRVQGKEILRKLVAGADVLVEGFRPATLDRLELGFEQLSEINPRLIYCAISGYGQDGPYRNRVGHDLNYLALSGILGLQSEVNNIAVLPIQIADIGAGALPAVAGILLALALRQNTGKGSLVDISMLDGLMSFMVPYAGVAREAWVRNPMLRGELACYNIYGTRDGRHVTVGCVEQKFWSAFCQAVGHAEWIPLQLEQGAVQSRMREDLQAMFLQSSAEEWKQFFAPHETCVEIVLLPEETEVHAQVCARGSVVQEEHPNAGILRQVQPAIRISGCTPRSSPAPAPGEHTKAVLESLGYSSEEIEHLKVQGVIRSTPAKL